MILHITTREAWRRALEDGAFRPTSLEREGFIHCSRPEQVGSVANTLYRGEENLVLLCIDLLPLPDA